MIGEDEALTLMAEGLIVHEGEYQIYKGEDPLEGSSELDTTINSELDTTINSELNTTMNSELDMSLVSEQSEQDL